MTKKLLINSRTAEALRLFTKSPGHAVLISGQVGAGKPTLAKHLAARLLDTDETRLESHAHFLHVKKAEDKKDISIEQIRRINRELGLKIPGKAAIQRVIFIEDAQLMSSSAQNALLKSLEEPSTYSVFILSAPTKNSLLPTISSRMNQIRVHPVDINDANNYYSADENEVESAWSLSRGMPGLMSKLLNDETSDLSEAVKTAKKLLGLSAYERSIELDKISRNKIEFELLLDALARIIQALYKASTSKNDARKLRRLTAAMSLVISARRALASNVSPRLVALQVANNLTF